MRPPPPSINFYKLSSFALLLLLKSIYHFTRLSLKRITVSKYILKNVGLALREFVELLNNIAFNIKVRVYLEIPAI